MSRRESKYFTQKGVALIAVTTALVIVGVLSAEFGTNTTVDRFAAANARDSMRAHFLMRSGANLAQLIIRVQTDVMDRYRKFLGDIQITDYTGLFMGAFGGGKEEVEALAAMVGGFQGEAIKGLGVSKFTTFDVQIVTEDGKLNMNCANGSETSRKTLQTQLEALFYAEGYDRIFQEPDAEGYQRTRAEQVSALMDYVDRDHTRADAPGTPERYDYESLKDPYKSKDNYIDTIGELKLARGVDDRFWTLFGSAFTVYGDCKINIGAVRDAKLIASIIFLSAKNPDDPVVRDPVKLWALAQRVAEARNMGVFFDDLNAFADYVKSPDGALAQLLGAEGTEASAALAAPPGQQPVEGVELDPAKLGQVAQAGPRRVYRVEVTATIDRPNLGPLSRKLTAIWDNNMQNQNMRDPAYSRGAWVFWREE